MGFDYGAPASYKPVDKPKRKPVFKRKKKEKR